MALATAGCGAVSQRPVATRSVALVPAGAAVVSGSSTSPGATVPSSSVVPTTSAAPTTVPQSATVNLSGSPTAAPVTLKPPTRVAIPSIGVTSAVIPLGKAADGSAQVPTTTGVVGWYDDGPEPGEPGPAVLLGHVDSYTGPAIFFHLRQLSPGALVNVNDGPVTVVFRVQSVQSYSKDQFPTAAVFGPTPNAALRLITCGGPFDKATGHYLENVVVFANEVGSAG